MKKVSTIMVLFVLVFAVCGFAAQKKVTQKAEIASGDSRVEWADKKNVITTNPLGLVLGAFNAHYEFALDAGSGIGIDGIFFWYNLGGWTFSSFGIGAEYNFYFQKRALNGWYAGPGAGLAISSASYKDDVTNETASASSPYFYINGHGGYRWIWDSFTLDLKFGIQYSLLSITLDVGGSSETLPIGGIGPIIGCNIGFAF